MKIAVVGATGATGRSIVNGLLESPTDFVCLPSPEPQIVVTPPRRKLFLTNTL